MRLGVLARSEDRGLGIQTWEVCRALDPALVLIVDMGELAQGFVQHHERFAPWLSAVVKREECGDRGYMTELLRGIDVLYYAETPYDRSVIEAAHDVGCRTINHVNPEFYTPDDGEPSALWLPSSWMAHRLPERAVPMPMPVPTDRWPVPVAAGNYLGGRPLRVLHVAGKPAMADRNGTRVLLAALRHVTSNVEVTVTTQAAAMAIPGRLPSNVTYTVRRGVSKYWELYGGFDVLVMPRRYGGLCLPVLEAAGAGLAVVMTDCEPNTDYPALLVESRFDGTVDAKMLDIPTYTADAQALARVIDNLADNPDVLRMAQELATTWAQARSWNNLKAHWLHTMEAL